MALWVFSQIFFDQIVANIQLLNKYLRVFEAENYKLSTKTSLVYVIISFDRNIKFQISE